MLLNAFPHFAHFTQNVIFFRMPLPKRRKQASKLTERSDQHPYVIKLNIMLYKLDCLMNQIYEIADSNLILTDARTGLNNFTMNELFAKKLDDISKHVTGLATRIQDKASELRDKIDKAIDTKENLREVIYAGEVLDWS